MDNRNESNAIASVLGEILVEPQKGREEHNQNFQTLIKQGERNAAISQMQTSLLRVADHLTKLDEMDVRVKRLEEILLKKGA